jgi:hypothetical protein
LIWEARAAAEAAQPGLADKSGGHLKDLKAWADKADSPVAKYYLGMISENDILNATAKDAVQMRLLTSAVGWKAESAGDFVKAAKWYAVAMNTGPQNIPDFVDLPVQRLQAMRDHFDFKKK